MPKIGEEDPVLVDDAARRRRDLSDDEDDVNLKKFLVHSRSKSRAAQDNQKGTDKGKDAASSGLKAVPFTAFQDRNIAAFDKYMYSEGLDIRSHLDQIEGIARDSMHHRKRNPYLSETSVRFSKISEVSRDQRVDKFLDWCAAANAANPPPVKKFPHRGRKKDTSGLGKAPKMPVKKSYSMVQFPLFNEEEEKSLVSRSLVRSNSTNVVYDLQELEWVKPFGLDDFDVDDTFLFDRFGEMEGRKQGTSLDDIELEKPPEYLK